MSNKFKVIAGALLLALALVIYMESSTKEDINWYPSYTKTDKIPYGTYVLHDLVEKNWNKEKFKEVRIPPYEFMSDSVAAQGTYLFVNDYILFSEDESLKLLSWVSKGNTLFIAARGIGETILDTLSLETDLYYDYDNFERKPLVNLVNPSLRRAAPYYHDVETTAGFFAEVDTINTIALGEFGLMAEKDTLTVAEPRINFIKQEFGKGEIIIHLMPETFTNYFILREDNYTYTNNALSYLDQDEVLYWDNHYKNGKTLYTSPLYIFFQNRYLKWAYYILLIGTFLWVVFEGRRKQRAIPIIKPLPNQTLTFTKTIAGMYLDKRDHKSIVTHQISHFLEFIRSNYGLDTNVISEGFINKLASKSGNTLEQTKLLINYMVALRAKQIISQEELLELNKRIEAFKNQK